ncbi:MAG TPA: sulfite exporter TauE/SafE family protein [Flavobacteriaceae bacterium]|nr:sulfite exporter TauE/SafE family protein [Flavobacteriaceae bacterium]MCB9212869.1 sulfite exporter TauE/SafE family protein [Alteromonas sp.]HPF11459.1 sulfite exporter TauE/SafE family protein [Flavobacteriaceae bacterium]HQU20622.1 sulfite exporter TauE/SafE family protein [Flavobacteriaceae bacterium]HQU65055.1 sulfite exporter TauE/SafE family protein [Flavobacteriaceae bacterium]
MMEGFGVAWPFLLLLPLVAFLYASVGHGGASGYLALMALFSFSPEVMKPTALLLNLFVAAIAFFHYYQSGYFSWKAFWPFAIASIPMAFLGGMIELDATLYRKFLGVLLIFAILKMLQVFGKERSEIRSVKIWQGLLVGGIIGYFSGLIGIGGGIVLTPVILLFHWGKMKEAAAISALFIWVNSAAGLLGQFTNEMQLVSHSLLLVGMALLGGFFGSYLGSKKLNNLHLRYFLALVLGIASLKLLLA